MAKFAVMAGNIVSNIIICDTKEIAEEVTQSTCVEYTDENPAHINDIWNGEEFIVPVTEEITND